MPVPKRRKSRAKRDMGRTHKKLSAVTLSTCASCGTPKLPHNACPNPDCGVYRGRPVLKEEPKA